MSPKPSSIKNKITNTLKSAAKGSDEGAMTMGTFSLAGLLGSDQVKDIVDDFTAKAEGYIRKHPVQFIGGALAAGLLAGMFFSDKPFVKKLINSSARMKH